MASTYLTRTPSSAGNLKKWTWSAWIKKSLSDGADVGVFGQYVDSNNYFRIRYRSDQRLQVDNYNSGSATFSVILGVEHRDPSGWYHLVVAYDSAQGTDSNRVKIYVNGVLQTVFQTAAYPSVNVDTKIPNTGSAIELGRTTQNQYFNGYMNNVAFVDGTALTPTSFGETDSTSGIWKFKSPSGITWGTNGVHLKMDNSGNLGLDSSGQTNNFTLSGNGRQAKDTPTNVRATTATPTWYDGTIANGGNTISTNQTSYRYQPSSLGVSTGKWYWEVKLSTASDYALAGITDAASPISVATTVILGSGAYDYSIYYGNGTTGGGNGHLYNNAGVNPGNTPGQFMAGFSQGDIITFALDLSSSTKKLYIGANGNWANGSNATDQTFSNSTGKTITAPSSTNTGIYFPAVGDYGGATSVFDLNFGNGYFGTTAITSAGSNGNGSLFEYDVPSGYYALNTKNINTYG